MLSILQPLGTSWNIRHQRVPLVVILSQTCNKKIPYLFQSSPQLLSSFEGFLSHGGTPTYHPVVMDDLVNLVDLVD